MDGIIPVRLRKRLLYSLLGLIAGNAFLLLFLLQSAVRTAATLMALHMGNPGSQIAVAFELWVFYGACSFVGWLFLGLPTVAFIRATSLLRLPWALRLLIGAALGPIALLIIFLLLAHGRLSSSSLTNTAVLWVYAILVSTISFVLYVALLSREIRSLVHSSADHSNP